MSSRFVPVLLPFSFNFLDQTLGVVRILVIRLEGISMKVEKKAYSTIILLGFLYCKYGGTGDFVAVDYCLCCYFIAWLFWLVKEFYRRKFVYS